MKTVTSLFTIATAAMLWSCNTSNTGDSATQADSANASMSDTATATSAPATAAEEDSTFAVEAANGGMAEVQLGELAQTKGTDPKVKEFGKMMVTDHTKANNELKTIATAKNITLPAAPDEKMKKAAEEISAKSGSDFDKAYIKQMVKDHEKTVKLFEDGQKNVKDSELKSFIDKTLPVLRSHLDHIKSLDKAK